MKNNIKDLFILNAIIGRVEEQCTLTQFLESSNASFLALYGRRRIGKTFLITTYFAKKKNCLFFYTTGIKNATYKKQISQFTKIIGDVFYNGADLKPKNNWLETFELLTDSFKNTPKNKKIVIFMDEFPWLATKRSGLLEALDYYWNRYWVDDKRIKLIICGSSSSWIVDKIINNKGGLHNRVTHKIQLDSFNLKETKEYLHALQVRLNNKQILQLYMITGGIPFYLSNIAKGLSATQIIEALAFKKNCLLLEEFDNLFSSLFDHPEGYIKAIKLISSFRYGIGQDALLHKLGKPMLGMGGVKILKDLERSGFIMSFKPHLHKKRGIYYKVIDEYVSFYFNWIEPIKETLLSRSLKAGYWETQHNSARWHSWSGYTFESICYKHISQISNALKLNSASIPNSWRYIPQKGSKENGAQIDLLFDRMDDAITICEIKYANTPFIIDKQYANNLLNKIETFKKITKTTKQIFLSMIVANGLQKNTYSNDLVVCIVTLDDLFK